MDATTFLLLGGDGANGGGHASPSLVVRGEFFGRADGSPWTGIMTSDFSAPKRFLEGEDLRPLYDERAAVGFNELRQWVLNESVVGRVYPGGIHPNQYPDFYDRLPRLWELCGSYGLAIEVTAFTSCVPLMPHTDDQHQHWERLQAASRGLGHVRLELVNEWNWGHGENAPDRSLWDRRPSGLIASSGSSTADAPPPEPVWDYVLYHSNGLDQWQRKVGHNAWEVGAHFRCPGAANENTRFPDDDSSEVHAYDAAAGGALLSASSCYHSQAGKYSRLFDATEGRCALAWCDGAKSVPLEFQRGQYIHRSELEGPDCIRAYERRLPDGRGHIVKIRP